MLIAWTGKGGVSCRSHQKDLNKFLPVPWWKWPNLWHLWPPWRSIHLHFYCSWQENPISHSDLRRGWSQILLPAPWSLVEMVVLGCKRDYCLLTVTVMQEALSTTKNTTQILMQKKGDHDSDWVWLVLTQMEQQLCKYMGSASKLERNVNVGYGRMSHYRNHPYITLLVILSYSHYKILIKLCLLEMLYWW